MVWMEKNYEKKKINEKLITRDMSKAHVFSVGTCLTCRPHNQHTDESLIIMLLHTRSNVVLRYFIVIKFHSCVYCKD